MTRFEGHVGKGWGREDIWATNDKYCGKFLHFNQSAKFSMHFHKEKDETWYVLTGTFRVHWINTIDASVHTQILNQGDVWRNYPLVPHQLECIEKGTIIEVSTADS